MPNAQAHLPAQQVAAIVQDMRAGLATLDQFMEVARPALDAGISLAQLRGVTPADCQALFEVAGQLCDAGDFDDALPITLQLAVHQPGDSRFSYLAGICLYQAGKYREAATMLGLSVVTQPQPGTLYCLGQCHFSLRETDKAIEAFETAYELCRGESRLRDLQDQCELGLKQARQTSGG